MSKILFVIHYPYIKFFESIGSSSGGWHYKDYVSLSKSFKVSVLFVDETFSNICSSFTSIGTEGMFHLKLGMSIENVRTDLINCFSYHDIVDFKGIEFRRNRDLITLVPGSSKAICSLQGIAPEISRCYLGEIKPELRKYWTFRRVVFKGTLAGNKRMMKRGKTAKNLVNLAHTFIGRTDYDENWLKDIRDEISYHRITRIPDEEFFKLQWSRNWLQPEKFCMTQGHYPLKGVHVVIEGLALYAKSRSTCVELNIAGRPRSNSWLDIKCTEYDLYLRKLERENQMYVQVNWIGWKNRGELKSLYLNSDVYIQGSFEENSSNSLLEAQSIGMPVVAANNAGNRSYIIKSNSSLLYKYNSPRSLAESLGSLVCDKNALKLNSNRLKKRQLKTGSSEYVQQVYQDILNG